MIDIQNKTYSWDVLAPSDEYLSYIFFSYYLST